MEDSMTTTTTKRLAARPRRGNTMVLVAGVLVLLVILAAAFISRAQGGRVTATAVRTQETTDDRADLIADMLAQEIGKALFADPLADVPGLGVTVPLDSNSVRDDAETASFFNADLSLRYSVDPAWPFNFAPYHVVPFTNWPDDFGPTGAVQWPKGPGAPNGVTTTLFNLPLAEGNPVGAPGFGDSRWLADSEPLRWDPEGTVGVGTAFKYWRHLTNIARSGNGWRVARHLANVTGEDPTASGGNLLGGIVLNLNVPHEQWLASAQPSSVLFDFETGNTLFDNNFSLRWHNWLGDNLLLHGAQYGTSLPNPLGIPPNFYELRDLNGDGVMGPDERPEASFQRFTMRWAVNSILDDADGDGFTDSFWFLAPTPIIDGVRQVVSVRIVDNCSGVNANTAGPFIPENTAGETPADVAAIGQAWDYDAPPVPPSWNVGFYDAFLNRGSAAYVPPGSSAMYGGAAAEVRWDPNRWPELMRETGVALDEDLFPFGLDTPQARRLFWLAAASRPLNPALGLTPFTLADDLELRLYHGQNYPWILSRYERAMNRATDDDPRWWLRSATTFEETSPHLDQLRNPELLHDSRHRLTMYSGARNDLLPPWLRWNWDLDHMGAGVPWPVPLLVRNAAIVNPADSDGDGVPDVVEQFLAQALFKLDLREVNPYFGYAEGLGLRLQERLPFVLMRALADGHWNGLVGPGGAAVNGHWYDGDYGAGSANEIRELAAALAANIMAYRDADALAPLYDMSDTTGYVEAGAIRRPDWERLAQPSDAQTRFLGMERQPFLMEAFIGHEYPTWKIPELPDGTGWSDSGRSVVLESQPGDAAGVTRDETVVVLQIANPFDRPIDLRDPRFQYEIDFLDEAPISLFEICGALGITELPPARADRPATMIIHSITGPATAPGGPPGGPGGGSAAAKKQRWLDFLDLEPGDHPLAPPPPGVPDNDTIIIDLHDPNLAGVVTPWRNKRSSYDNASASGGVRLVRVDTTTPLIDGVPVAMPPRRVVIDRFDDPSPSSDPDPDPIFAEIVKDMSALMPPAYEAADNLPDLAHTQPHWDPASPPASWVLPGTETHWVQWARVSRAWGYDVDADGEYTPDESNPRYVSARKTVTTANDTANGFPDSAGGEPEGNAFDLFTGDPDVAVWFKLPYPGSTLLRKPTFFDFNHAEDPVRPEWSFPNKGFRHSRNSMQMLQKDADFQQVGELLNVWLYGHKLRFDGAGMYVSTERTFSEYMLDADDELADDPLANRLHAGELVGASEVIAGSTLDYAQDPQHAVPILPAGLRVLEAFVCDGPGDEFDPSVDDPSLFTFGNAGGFAGTATQGLINVNTAPVEVLRALPHWYKLVHADVDFDAAQHSRFPRSALPEAVVSYRERFLNNPSAVFTDPNATNLGFSPGPLDAPESGPDYSDRGDLRGERGFASIGEVLLVDAPSVDDPLTMPDIVPPQYPYPQPRDEMTLHVDSWRRSFAARNPFELRDPPAQADIKYGARLSTDVNGPPLAVDAFTADGVAGDSEEENLLFAGASNLITTRSDVFTVYFHVRSFRQNPAGEILSATGAVLGQGPVWDATDPEYIVDDARYVMLVDRGNVNRPGDKPRILYLRKVTN
jgi:hypothetical protein